MRKCSEHQDQLGLSRASCLVQDTPELVAHRGNAFHALPRDLCHRHPGSYASRYLDFRGRHLAGFKRLHKVDRSELIWLPEHIDAFMNSASLEMQRALILALHSGQRQGDLLKLAWNNYDGSFLTLRQGKTGRKVDIPCTVALKRMLDGMNRSATVVLTTTTGRPWTARHFKAQWHKAAIAAGINHLHFHDLRGTAVTMLAEAGCSALQIAAITGHSLRTVDSILDRYLARTRALATSAINILENASSTESANRLQTRANPKAGVKAR